MLKLAYLWAVTGLPVATEAKGSIVPLHLSPNYGKNKSLSSVLIGPKWDNGLPGNNS